MPRIVKSDYTVDDKYLKSLRDVAIVSMMIWHNVERQADADKDGASTK